MAVILPGVESARRRRMHQSGGCWDSPSSSLKHGGYTRRSGFCLHISSTHDAHNGSGYSQKRGLLNKGYQDGNSGLVGAAREAKERLDGRLWAESKSDTKRHASKTKLRAADGRNMVLANLHTEVFGSRKKKSIWSNLSWKASDQKECAICLERYKAGEILVHLPCAHGYHVNCLVPWLENNAHCPCCRTGVFTIQ